jgi:transposase InsO family protein
MIRPEAPLELSAGTRLVVAGSEWTVESFHPQLGQVDLARGDGQKMTISVRALIHQPDAFRASNTGLLPASGRGRQPTGLDDLTDAQRDRVRMRFAHLMEAEIGYRSGDPLRPAPGEPRPGYDPAATTLTARRETKVAELRALSADEARILGLDQVSVRSLKRWAAQCHRFGITGCIKGQWLRRSGEHPSVTEPVREAIFAVQEETLHRSRVSMKTRERMICHYLADRYGPEVTAPSYPTLLRVWREWFGTGGARQRYARSAARLPSTSEHVVVHRPGQVVALDTTQMSVLVRETVFGDPRAVFLTLALDVYTRSIVAFRLNLVSDTSVDVAMLLRDVMMPLPLREDWGPDMEWPYPGVPAAIVTQFAGHKVAGLPFFAPETVTTDHGSVYKNHHLVDVQRVIGASILPARVLRPTDKQAVERVFGSIQSLLFELLLGYRGVDVADRGADPESDAVLSIAEMEHLIATWVVKIWQNRELGEHAPAWDPDTRHSPNTLFAAAMGQGGFALQIPSPQLYYELLPAHHVVIHGVRGVKIRSLWYDGPALEPYRGGPSSRGGAHKGKWVIRRDPRDRRYVYFCDPLTHGWHTLRWVGLPPAGEVPSFGDSRATELVRAAKAAGLTPRTDAELLPLLLELIGGHIPVEAWPTQMTKSHRTAHAREMQQGRTAAADRPTNPAVHATPPEPVSARPEPGTVTALHGPDRAQQVVHALDDERRRRREQAIGEQPIALPPPLGDQLRRSNRLLLLPGAGAERGATSDPVPGNGSNDG